VDSEGITVGEGVGQDSEGISLGEGVGVGRSEVSHSRGGSVYGLASRLLLWSLDLFCS
jgi:hypothetical protein